MDLLNDILRNPMDPDYRAIAEGRRIPRPASKISMLIIALLIGAMFTLSAVQTTRSAPAAATEREHLIRQARDQEREQETLRNDIEQLRTDSANQRAGLLADSEDARLAQAEIERLAPGAGEIPVIGPGLVIVVDDAPAVRDDKLNRVLDKDLQMMVNALWFAGAEAVAINGHRVSGLTAIRSAGDAVTVNYRSLTRPYRVEAIGDPQTLAARFADSPGGQAWQALAQNYQMRFDIAQADQLQLRADPSLALKHARRAT
ncbi:DUF881 domain-containing protein [Granulicoccus sp. GXG6511]|uniref:DUF881 domain-containing protein n=1 Tax=Granulicoccus sp. GXG6511 TaxID=3381351 RepID=UPI003D7D5713